MTGHDTPFIATIVLSLAAAYAGGLAARFVNLPNIVGYVAAGIVVGPYTPGFVADQNLTMQLAEIGVALLMFTIGLHFSVRDLLAREGKIKQFTGIDDPYEAPETPELSIDTLALTPDEAADLILAKITEMGLQANPDAAVEEGYENRAVLGLMAG